MFIYREPFADDDGDDNLDDEDVAMDTKKQKTKPVKIDIDLGLSAYANARK